MSRHKVFKLVERGDKAYKDGKYEEAMQHYLLAIEAATRSNVESDFIYSSLAKVYKKTGDFLKAYKISRKALPTPAAFRDSAIALRGVARTAKKSGDHETLKRSLNELYRLGVLAYLCYDSHNCRSGVAGFLFERAKYIYNTIGLENIKVKYWEKGKINRGGLLSERDYKLLDEEYGPVTTSFNPYLEYKNIIKQANQQTRKKLRANYSKEDIKFYMNLAPHIFED